MYVPLFHYNNQKLNIMSKSLYEQMLGVVEYYEAHRPLKIVTTSVYRNKKDQTEVITPADFTTAFLAGKSIKDYDLITDVFNPKAELAKMIFGDAKPKVLQIAKFFEVCEKLTGVTITAPIEAEEVEKDKGFAKKMNAINQKIIKAKKDNKPDLERKFRGERIFLYFGAGKVPKASFKDWDLYNELKPQFETLQSDYDEAMKNEK